MAPGTAAVRPRRLTCSPPRSRPRRASRRASSSRRRVASHDHRNGRLARGSDDCRASSVAIHLHALIPQRLCRQDLPAHDALDREAQPRTHPAAQTQKQRGYRRRKKRDDPPQHCARRALTARRFGENSPQDALQRARSSSRSARPDAAGCADRPERSRCQSR